MQLYKSCGSVLIFDWNGMPVDLYSCGGAHCA